MYLKTYSQSDIIPYTFPPIILLRVTPTAKRNSYRVAILVGALTQGSVLRPQPWAGETQLRQSCQGCVPSTTSPPQGASCCGLVYYNLLQVTPTAKRNSYRVAILVGAVPRVACFARNPGLGNRNSVRVAAACGVYNQKPLPSHPQEPGVLSCCG